MSRRPWLLVAIAALVVGGASALVLARGPAEPATIAERGVEVASGLRCPVCQSLSVADSDSQLAHEMRRTIESMLREGKSAGEIRAYFVDRFGEWILLAPRPSGLGLIPWILPGALLAVGIIAVVGLLRRRGARTRGRPPPQLDPADRARIADALASFEEPA